MGDSGFDAYYGSYFKVANDIGNHYFLVIRGIVYIITNCRNKNYVYTN